MAFITGIVNAGHNWTPDAGRTEIRVSLGGLRGRGGAGEREGAEGGGTQTERRMARRGRVRLGVLGRACLADAGVS